MGIFDFLYGAKERNIKELLNKGAIILDVRTQAEWDKGHNKKFLETDYPRGGAIEVPACQLAGFANFILTEEAKNRNFIFCLTRNCQKRQFRPLPRRG